MNIIPSNKGQSHKRLWEQFLSLSDISGVQQKMSNFPQRPIKAVCILTATSDWQINHNHDPAWDQLQMNLMSMFIMTPYSSRTGVSSNVSALTRLLTFVTLTVNLQGERGVYLFLYIKNCTCAIYSYVNWIKAFLIETQHKGNVGKFSTDKETKSWFDRLGNMIKLGTLLSKFSVFSSSKTFLPEKQNVSTHSLSGVC